MSSDPTLPQDEITQHHQSILRALMDQGATIAKAIAQAASTNPAQAAQAFEQIARAIRRTILLAEKLAEPRAIARTAKHHPAPRPATPLADTPPDREIDPNEARSLRTERLDRPESPEDDSEFDDDIDRPIADIIAEICEDMGLDNRPYIFPWPRQTQEDRQLATAQATQTLMQPPNPPPPTTRPKPPP